MSYIESEVIVEDAIIDMKINVSVFRRLNELAYGFFPFKDQEHMLQVIDDIKKGENQDDPYVYHFYTLLSILLYIEESAREQGKTKKIKIDKETGKIIEEDTQ